MGLAQQHGLSAAGWNFVSLSGHDAPVRCRRRLARSGFRQARAAVPAAAPRTRRGPAPAAPRRAGASPCARAPAPRRYDGVVQDKAVAAASMANRFKPYFRTLDEGLHTSARTVVWTVLLRSRRTRFVLAHRNTRFGGVPQCLAPSDPRLKPIRAATSPMRPSC